MAFGNNNNNRWKKNGSMKVTALVVPEGTFKKRDGEETKGYKVVGFTLGSKYYKIKIYDGKWKIKTGKHTGMTGSPCTITEYIKG